MKKNDRLTSRTMLEYLVTLNEQSYSGIGRELNITPQQFSDWIKRRRPVPQERLEALSSYFGVPKSLITDEKQFAAFLTDESKTQLHILLVDREIRRLEGEQTEEDIEPFLVKKQQLIHELENRKRLEKIAAILEGADERAAALFDSIIEAFERGGIEKWLQRTGGSEK